MLKVYFQSVPAVTVRLSTSTPSRNRRTVMLVGRLPLALLLSFQVFVPERSVYFSGCFGISLFVIVMPETVDS